MDPHIYEAFKSRNPHTTSLDAVLEIVRDEVNARLAEHERELIGLAMRINPKPNVSFNGTMSADLTKEWLSTRCELKPSVTENGSLIEDRGEPGYDGKIWFRLDQELPPGFGSVNKLFEPSMIHVGGGGYSTWQGPWNAFGKEMESYNIGLPWGLKGTLAAYAYDMHFFKSDIPGLDHMEVMLKLQDRELEKEYYLEWQRDGQPESDRDLIEQLQSLREQLELK